MPTCVSSQASQFTSAIHKALGKEARMKTPMACYGSTFQKGPILAVKRQQNWMRLHILSTRDLGKHSTGKFLRKFSTDSLQDNRIKVLRRSFESAQYTSEQFRALMADNGVACSMSRSGNVWDNAAMESFFSSLKTERTARKTYRSRSEAKADVFDYIERFYNPKRRHSTLGYLSPIAFERKAGLA